MSGHNASPTKRELALKIRSFFTEIGSDLFDSPQGDQLDLMDLIDAESGVLRTLFSDRIREKHRHVPGPLKGPPVRREGRRGSPQGNRYSDVLKGPTNRKVSKRPPMNISSSRRKRTVTTTTSSFKEGEKGPAVHWMKAIVANHLDIPQNEVQLTKDLKGPGLNVARDLYRREKFNSSNFEKALKDISIWSSVVFHSSFKDEEKEHEQKSGSGPSTTRTYGKGVQRLKPQVAKKATAKKRFAKARHSLSSLMITIEGWKPLKGSTLKVHTNQKLKVKMVSILHFARICNATLKLQNNASRSGLQVPHNLPSKIPEEFLEFWVKEGFKTFQQPEEQGGMLFLNMQDDKGQPLADSTVHQKTLSQVVPWTYWSSFKKMNEKALGWIS